VLYGNVSLTPHALRVLLRQGVDTVFLSLDGRFQGRLETPESKNVFLRKRQFLLSDELPFRLHVTRSLLRGKLLNMATLLLRIKRGRDVREAGLAADDIRGYAGRLDAADSLERLRGLEGAASARYFGVLRHGLIRDWGFRKRVRRPPTDPVNSILSLIYTFSINRMYAAVRQAGLDPFVGNLHDLDYGRHSLPLDLVEEFRPIVADALALSLFNLGVLAETDFFTVLPQEPAAVETDTVDAALRDPLHAVSLPEDTDLFDIPVQHIQPWTSDEADGKRPVRLHPPAFKRVITAFEKKMDSTFTHPLAGKTLSYAEAMVFQARLYRRVVEGEAEAYVPLTLK